MSLSPPTPDNPDPSPKNEVAVVTPTTFKLPVEVIPDTVKLVPLNVKFALPATVFELFLKIIWFADPAESPSPLVPVVP